GNPLRSVGLPGFLYIKEREHGSCRWHKRGQLQYVQRTRSLALSSRGPRVRTTIQSTLMLGALLALSFPVLLRAQEAGVLEVKFCPAEQVRTYPLESRRDIRSLVLQNLLVINHRSTPVDVTEVNLALMQGGEALDVRRIQGAELKQYTAGGPKLQASGMLEMLAFQFCSTSLIP